MFTPWNISCHTDTIRGQLKHSWLENQLCSRNISADDVVTMWRNRNWQALDKEFDIRVQQTIELADDLEYGFSPVQLVDRLSQLNGFSAEFKEQVKDALHVAYLESSNILELKEPLRNAALALGEAIQVFRSIWNGAKSADGETRLLQAWEKMNMQAISLLAIIERLPKGVVLP